MFAIPQQHTLCYFRQIALLFKSLVNRSLTLSPNVRPFERFSSHFDTPAREIQRVCASGLARRRVQGKVPPMVMACSHSSHFALSSDEELAGRASVGSRHATELLLARYRPLVESKARAYFLMGADHDDVVQEGMIGLYKAIRDFRAERLARFRAFADLCVTRQIISAVKTATRQKHAMLTTCVSLNQTLGADGEGENVLLESLPDRRAPDPQQCLVTPRENGGRLDAIRATLSPLEIQVLDCYLQGKSYREMSSELCCQTKAMDNALQRVKRKICQTGLPD